MNRNVCDGVRSSREKRMRDIPAKKVYPSLYLYKMYRERKIILNGRDLREFWCWLRARTVCLFENFQGVQNITVQPRVNILCPQDQKRVLLLETVNAITLRLSPCRQLM